MKLQKLLYIGVAGLVSLTSCSDFLDHLPDNRIDPQNPKQLQLMLVDGYVNYDYATMCELSSDNMVDNHAPDASGVTYEATGSKDPILDQFFAWEDANMSSKQDSPTAVWQGCYHAIAVANHALKKVEEFKAAGKFTTGEDADRLNAAYGEALLVRAYHHFILVNLFSKQYGKNSATDQGIPYSTEPEDKVQVAYERGTVAQVYDKIEADLIEGLKYVSDQYYSVLRYHFNTTAANAFAARFYLFKRDYVKAEQYATAALGASPAEKMRKDYWSTSFTSLNSDATTFYSSSSSSNFLLIPTNSIAFISMCNNYYAAGARYACNRGAATSTLYGYGPCWDTNFLPTMAQHLYVNSKQEYGMWPSWMYMLFEYTDKVAGIGYPKRIRAEFTGEETLLTRAEARIFMGKIDEAVSDLNIWAQSHDTDASHPLTQLTSKVIKNWYNKENATSNGQDPRAYILQDLNIEQVCEPAPGNTSYTLDDNKLPYLWCALHFRRIDQVFTGTRWFDIKRFGIEITHQIGRTRTEVLKLDDDRRAFQIPTEAIQAGLTPTPRAVKGTTESAMTKANLNLSIVR